MSESRKKADWSIIAALVVAALLLLPILDVLSIGPAAVLFNNGYLSDSTFQVVYGPLKFAYERSSWARAFFDWYVLLWVARP